MEKFNNIQKEIINNFEGIMGDYAHLTKDVMNEVKKLDSKQAKKYNKILVDLNRGLVNEDIDAVTKLYKDISKNIKRK